MPQLTVRQEQHPSELSVRVAEEVAAKRLGEGNLHGLEEGVLVDGQHAAARCAAAQDDDVPHGALGGIEAACAARVAFLQPCTWQLA